MSDRIINVLHFVPTLKSGGIETLLYEYYSLFDRSIISFSFVTHAKDGIIYNKLINENVKVYYLAPKANGILKFIANLKKLFSKEHFDIVHVHQGHMSFLPLYLAKRANIEHRISHIHWTNYNEGVFKKLINYFLSHLVKKFATDYLACSKHAAYYLYGKRFVNNGKVNYLHNAVNLVKFRYNEEVNLRLRKELNIKEKYVIGMIGRFTYEKNHKFTIDVFNKIAEKNTDIRFVFLGDGTLRSSIESLVLKSEFSDKFLFLGNRDDVADLLSMIDLLIHPSLFEGLGIAIIEAQACGVKCLVSDLVPKEVSLSDLVLFLSLDLGPEYWCNKILKELNYIKESRTEELKIANYSLELEVPKFEKYYIDLVARL